MTNNEGLVKVIVVGRTIERTQMAPFIAVAKLQAVARLIRTAQPKNTHQGALNETLITEAIWFARKGETTKAFAHLAKAKVPTGQVASCCGLRSSLYGCATHGYPRCS